MVWRCVLARAPAHSHLISWLRPQVLQSESASRRQHGRTRRSTCQARPCCVTVWEVNQEIENTFRLLSRSLDFM